MNGVLEMASEFRRTLILCSRSAFVATSISPGGSAVDSIYFLQTDLWTGMISRNALILDQSRFGHLAMPIGPVIGTNLTGAAAQLADDELGKTKWIQRRMMTII